MYRSLIIELVHIAPSALASLLAFAFVPPSPLPFPRLRLRHLVAADSASGSNTAGKPQPQYLAPATILTDAQPTLPASKSTAFWILSWSIRDINTAPFYRIICARAILGLKLHPNKKG
jgi:hypothetical protein